MKHGWRAILGAAMCVGAIVALPSAGVGARTTAPAYVRSYGEQGSGLGELFASSDVVVHGSEVFVADRGNDKVVVFGLDGTYLRTIGSGGSGATQLSQPRGIDVGPDGNIYVTDQLNGRVQVYETDGDHVRSIPLPDVDENTASAPFGIAIDSDGTLYVTDTARNSVVKVAADGTVLDTFGDFGIGDGQFSFPWGVSVDGDGHVFVVDANNYRVEVLTTDGSFVSAFGSAGTGDGQFQVTYGVDVGDDGNVYVTDGVNHVQVFTADGVFITKWGANGFNPSQARFPEAIHVTDNGDVYLVDTYNGQVDVFADITKPTAQLVAPAEGETVEMGAEIVADYSCSDDTSGFGLDTCVGPAADGAFVDTSTVGDHVFEVTATDKAGNTKTVSHSYSVTDVTEPIIAIIRPAEGAVYPRGSATKALFACSDEAGGSGVASCVGTVANGSAIDTSSDGLKQFTVSAEDNAHNTASTTVTYRVATGRPDARVKVGKKFIGNGVYGSPTGQTTGQKVAANKATTFIVKIENDALFGEKIAITGKGSSAKFAVVYSDSAGHDITKAVRAGTFRPSIAAGKSVVVKVKVTPTKKAKASDALTVTVRAASSNHPDRTDAVTLVTTRS